MALVTPIGSDIGQVDYRLGQGHGCENDRQFSYHTDGAERPLIWVGQGLPEVGIEPGRHLKPEDFDKARALMSGQDPRNGEQLVEAKLAVPDDAKVPLAPLVAAIQTQAKKQDVEPADLFAGRKRRDAYLRAERAVAKDGDAAKLRADHAGQLADSAGVKPAQVWDIDAFTTANANLWETKSRTDEEGNTVEEVVPRRKVVGNRGYDVTFTLPKSMSLLLAFGEEDTAHKIERLYATKVGETFDWLEDETAYGMRGQHGRGKRATRVDGSGFLGWTMTHRAARPVGDADVGDPHWHQHITIANMTKGSDGQWSTVAAGGRDLMRHVAPADKVLQALIRRELVQTYGVEFKRSERTNLWEVAAIPDDTIRAFSKRGVQIEDMLKDLGFDAETASRRAEVLAADQTRQDKNQHTTTADDTTVRGLWAAEDEANGGGAKAAVDQALDGQPVNAAHLTDQDFLLDHIVARVTDPEHGLTAHNRRFTRVEAIGAVADAMPAGAADQREIAEMTDRVLAQADIIPLDIDAASKHGKGARRQLGAAHHSNADSYTTKDIVDAEYVILTYAGMSAPGQQAAHVTPEVAAMAQDITEAGQGFRLSDEQASIYRSIVTSDQHLATVIGPPGTGKTTLMRAVRGAYEADNKTVAGAATAAVAAQNLQVESGIESKTVAQWVHAINHGNGLDGVDVLVLDEANLTDDRDREVLYRESARTQTKLVEVGDPKQLRGVGCGSLFNEVHEAVAGHELTVNRRQRDEDERAAISAWRDGRYQDALSSWGDRGRLTATDTGHESATAMVSEWMKQRTGAPDAHAEIRGVVMVAATNEQVDRINDAAQAIRAAQGELGAEHTYRTTNGHNVHLAENDHVLVKLNDRNQRMHQGPDVLNGYRGVIESINSDNSVQVAWQQEGDDGNATIRATLDEQFIRKGGLRLGYAMTAHKTEGLTVSADWTTDDGTAQRGSVLVQAAGLDQAGFHVATSRHKGEVHIFAGIDQLEDLATRTSKDAPGSDADRSQRVREELAKTAKRTADNINDHSIHEDLGQQPAADAKTMTPEQRRAALQQIRDNLKGAPHRPRRGDPIIDEDGQNGPTHDPPVHNT